VLPCKDKSGLFKGHFLKEELKLLNQAEFVSSILPTKYAERNKLNLVIFVSFVGKLNFLDFKIILQNILEGKILWDFQNNGYADYVRMKISED
jgi:hypothetical protein